MSELPQVRANELKRMSSEFGRLSHAEGMLLQSCTTGKMFFCGPSDDDQDESNNPKNADTWGPKRQIRTGLISWLCQQEQPRTYIHPHGIQVCGAEFIGRLDLSHSNIPFPLTLQHCRFKKGIDLSGAELSDLDLDGSAVHDLSADSTIVHHYLSMANGFKAIGEVNLLGAQIGRNFECQDGTFNNEHGIALRCDGITVGGDVFFRHGFCAKGEVRLLGAQLGGGLDCEGGSFSNEGQTALNADRISVKESVFLRHGKDLDGKERHFSAQGEVNFALAQIDGMLDCEGGGFINSQKGGFALKAFRVVVKSSVALDDGFEAEGKVSFSGARISGYLNCANGRFANATLDLNDASVGTFVDSGLNDPADNPADPKPTIWPQQGKLFLDGFVYGRISSSGRINAGNRIRYWLELQPQYPFASQPYMQLAKILRECGDSAGAKTVLIQMEDQMRKSDSWAFLERPLLRLTIGYGYEPIRAFWWTTGLSLLGWVIYRRSYLAGGIVPTDKEACEEFKKAQRKASTHYPSFSPFIYSVENSLPLVKLGQRDKWQPDPEPNYWGHQAPPALDYTGVRRGKGLQKPLGEVDVNFTSSSPSVPIDHVPILTAISSQVGTAAIAPALAPDNKEKSPKAFSVFQRLLYGVRLNAGTKNKKPSLLRLLGTSPRFLIWFVWIHVLLGWLLATLFVAGVSGIVHKD